MPLSTHKVDILQKIFDKTNNNFRSRALPKAPHIQYLWVKALMMTGRPIVVIMHRSEKARFTTNMFDGVLKLFTFRKM